MGRMSRSKSILSEPAAGSNPRIRSIGWPTRKRPPAKRDNPTRVRPPSFRSPAGVDEGRNRPVFGLPKGGEHGRRLTAGRFRGSGRTGMISGGRQVLPKPFSCGRGPSSSRREPKPLPMTRHEPTQRDAAAWRCDRISSVAFAPFGLESRPSPRESNCQLRPSTCVQGAPACRRSKE